MEFSGASVGSGSDSAWAANLQIQADNAATRLSQKTGKLLQSERQKQFGIDDDSVDTIEWAEQLKSLLDQYEDQVVLKRIVAAELISDHMPVAHREHMQWRPSRSINWAGTIGPQTRALVEAILASRPHPEMGYRSCLGILRLGKRYGEARLEAGCARAFAAGARSYRHVDSILKNGLDRVPADAATERPRPPGSDSHQNIRGPNYYN